MTDLVERLRRPLVMSMFVAKDDLLSALFAERTEAATALTAKDKEIEALKAKVTEQQDGMELLAREHMLLARDFDSLNARSDVTRRRAETAEKRVKELQHSYDLAIGARLEWRRQAETAERERDEARKSADKCIQEVATQARLRGETERKLDEANAIAVSLRRERDEARAALTPSADTKAAYIGEFHFEIEDRDEYGEDCSRKVTVPWTTIKEIMAAIRTRAARAVIEKENTNG